MPERLPAHPLTTLYGKPALELAQGELESFEVVGLPEVMRWIKGGAAGLTEGDLREPTISLPLFEPYVQTVLRLAQAVPDLTRANPTYQPVELEEVAALLVSTFMVRLQASKKVSAVSSSPEGEEVAKRRGWSTLQDPILALLAYEAELVVLGDAVLQEDPELFASWQEKRADDSFTSVAFSVRRRLSLVFDHKARFAGTELDDAFVATGKALHKDAWLFFRGREGRLFPQQELTLARDQAFTLLLPRLERLQRTLRAAYRKDENALRLLNAEHWRNLDRISKPRKPRKAQEPSSPKEAQAATAGAPTGQSD